MSEIASNYTETREPFGQFTKIKVENVETGHSFEVIPEKGAKLNSLMYSNRKKTFTIIDGYSTPEDVDANSYSKSSILAPFPNRTADGVYSFEGEEYRLPISMPEEHNAIHGFIENESFAVLDSQETERGYEIRLQHKSLGNREGYPFPFTITVVYRLTKEGLEIETSVVNIGDSNMPFGLGWHPYFQTEGVVDNLELVMSDVEQLDVDERLIPTGGVTAYSTHKQAKQIGKTEFDTGYRFIGPNHNVAVIDRTNDLTISIEMGDAYNYVQLFTPPWRTSIAIEPMSCAADALHNKLGLKILEPGKQFTADFKINISSN